MTYSPLEQFNIVSLIDILPEGINISFTNSSLLLVLSFLTVVGLLSFSTTSSTIVPNRWQSVVEIIYEFIMTLIDNSIGARGKQYFPFLFVLFMFILSCNLLGLIPYSFTVTSHIAVTFGLSLSIFIGVIIIGFLNHGIKFFGMLLPAGTPTALIPLLVAIETLSFFSRVLSLAIRLFANMMSGHILLKILAGFAYSMLAAGGLIFVGGIVTSIIIFAIMGLELGVSMIQAYVFTTLVCTYLNDSIHLH